jgi:hypothetical protein
MRNRGWLLLGTVTGIVGGFYEFVPRARIRALAPDLLLDILVLGHRIRHNDLILLGTALLIVSLVSFYKVYHDSRRPRPAATQSPVTDIDKRGWQIAKNEFS